MKLKIGIVFRIFYDIFIYILSPSHTHIGYSYQSTGSQSKFILAIRIALRDTLMHAAIVVPLLSCAQRRGGLNKSLLQTSAVLLVKKRRSNLFKQTRAAIVEQ